MTASYAIRVEGHLDDHWSARLGGLAISRCADGTTLLIGRMADQSQLYGVLAGLRDIGAALISVEVDDPGSSRGRNSSAHDSLTSGST